LTISPGVRRTLLVLIGLFLVWLAWTGLSGGVNQLSQPRTPGQTAQTVTQFCFGLFALLSLVTTFRGRRWNRFMLAGWTVSVTLAAGLASVVWGGTSVLIGIVSGASALLVGLAVAWLLRFAARGLMSI
jgi:hypothetical protein